MSTLYQRMKYSNQMGRAGDLLDEAADELQECWRLMVKQRTLLAQWVAAFEGRGDYPIHGTRRVLDLPSQMGAGVPSEAAASTPLSYDPTPWCSYCGSMTKKGCDCGEIAENN
jgi:hypothetical protein